MAVGFEPRCDTHDIFLLIAEKATYTTVLYPQGEHSFSARRSTMTSHGIPLYGRTGRGLVTPPLTRPYTRASSPEVPSHWDHPRPQGLSRRANHTGWGIPHTLRLHSIDKTILPYPRFHLPPLILTLSPSLRLARNESRRPVVWSRDSGFLF